MDPEQFTKMIEGAGAVSTDPLTAYRSALDAWGQVLAPLSDFREKLLFIRGLYNEEALKGNIHSSQTGNLLSGAPLASGGEIRSGTSIDQLLAQRYGQIGRAHV